MSDCKEYVSRPLENGSLHISVDALAVTAAQAVTEVEGVYGLGGAPRKNAGRGIFVLISEDNTVSVDCYIVVLYGHSVVDVAKAVQNAVTLTIESMTGSEVSNVNVSISGISYPRSSKK